LAGPVVAAAVMLNDKIPIRGLADSKKLTALRRERLYDEIMANALCCSIAEASVEEIDELIAENKQLRTALRLARAQLVEQDAAMRDRTDALLERTTPTAPAADATAALRRLQRTARHTARLSALVEQQQAALAAQLDAIEAD
jgi:ribonuclease HII